MTAESTEALAFKIPSEPGWRVVALANADTPDLSVPAQLELRAVFYWGVSRKTEAAPMGLALMLAGLWHGPVQAEFRPLNAAGKFFDYMLETVSPLDARPDDEIIAAIHTRIAADPIARAARGSGT